jgi:hypothetical protein
MMDVTFFKVLLSNDCEPKGSWNLKGGNGKLAGMFEKVEN